MNLTEQKEEILCNWSVLISPRSGLVKCGKHVQFNLYRPIVNLKGMAFQR
jgi:hypothetical protein